jgi:hypothetical protein
MKGTNQAIYNLLKVNEELLAMLGSNTPIIGTGTASTANSIVPSDLVNKKLNTPYITIQEGNENKSGGHTMNQSFFIRCYNDDSKGYIEINEILDKIREILNGSELTLEDRRFIEINFESRLPGLREETMQQKFKEERYRVKVL